MTKIYNINEQSGRSMVEMLGVLAIVGVLSIGGIAGYSKAMAKYKINKTLDQISLIVTNIRTAFGNQQSYKGLTTTTAISYELVGNDLTLGSSTSLTNAFNGKVTIEAGSTTGGACTGTGASDYCPTFSITYEGLDQITCGTIAAADWGGTASSGLYSIKITPASGSAKTHTWTKTGDESLPLEFFTAMTQCVDIRKQSKGNSITWVYF